MTWNLSAHQATRTWNCGLSSINTSDWRQGWQFQDGPWQGASFCRLPEFGPVPADAESDVYVRQQDLVLTRGACQTNPLRYQVYYRPWTELPAGVQAATEVVISVQTPAWEIEPELLLTTTIPGAAFATQFHHEVEIATTDGLFLQLTHPLDFIDSQVTWRRAPETHQTGLQLTTEPELGQVEVQQRLFSRRLEKGVILRARLWLGWATLDVEQFDWEECRARFLATEPMLTV